MDKIIDLAIVRGINADTFMVEVKQKVQEKQRDNQAVTVQFNPTFDQKKERVLYIAFIEVRG